MPLVRLVGRAGGARPGRKVLTLVHAMVVGASHIDHADVLRSGGTERVVAHRVMAPSTLGTFLRAFTFGHVRQLEAVVGEVLGRTWALGAGPGSSQLVIDVDSNIWEVEGHHKHAAAFGYTKVLGYHPILASRADTGEVLHRLGATSPSSPIYRATPWRWTPSTAATPPSSSPSATQRGQRARTLALRQILRQQRLVAVRCVGPQPHPLGGDHPKGRAHR